MADTLKALRARVEAAQKLATEATPGPYHLEVAATPAGETPWGEVVLRHHPAGGAGTPIPGLRVTWSGRAAWGQPGRANASLLAAAPDLVTLATDLLAALEAVEDESCAADLHRNLNRRVAGALGLLEPRIDPEDPDLGEYLPSWHDMPERVAALVAELDAIRAALGNGADEAAWPPGLTVAGAVVRLRGEHHSLRDVLQWVNDQCPGKCSAVCDSVLRAGHEGPHAEALGDNGGTR